MIKFFKKLLVLALIVLIVGAVAFTVAFAISGFSFEKMTGIKTSYVTFEENGGSANKLVLNFDTWDIHVKFDGQSEKISVVYPERTTKSGHKLNSVSFTEADGTVSVIEQRSLKSQLFLWDFKAEKVEVTIPKHRPIELFIEADTSDVIFDGDTTLTRLSVETDTGDINTKKSALTVLDTVNLEVDTGDIKLSKLEALTLIIETNTGDVELGESVIASYTEISTDTGDVDFNGSFVCELLKLETDTGDIGGEDATVDANVISIETDTGDIELRMAGNRGDYETFVNSHTGKSNIASHPGGPKKLTVETDTGDIEIDFADE